MVGRPRNRELTGLARILGSDALLAASSLMSCRWTQDNLITSHPALLYNGNVLEPIEVPSLEPLIFELASRLGPFEVGEARMGVFTWDLACEGALGPFTLQVPRVLDEPGKRARSKRAVPALNVENMRHFIAQGLGRFVLEPKGLETLGGRVPAALLSALPGHRPVTFGRGCIQIELSEGEESWLVPLGSQLTADLLAEMVAILVYHYEVDVQGGLAITDVSINDGDFVARRSRDGSFDVRLVAARRREPGIGPSLLLLYLIQMMAYEDWEVDDNLVGLPVLVGNPSVTFTGTVRGLRYRYRDLGRPEEEGEQLALAWLRAFGRSREGRAYRPWVDCFVEGRLPLSFGDDPREHWWRLVPLQTKLGRLELSARKSPSSGAARSAERVRSFIDRLSREIGRSFDDCHTATLNDLDEGELSRMLERAGEPAESRRRVARDVLEGWPYRSMEDLLARAPSAHRLSQLQKSVGFGHVVSQQVEGTLKSLSPLSRPNGTRRALANAEVYGGLCFPSALQRLAAEHFQTFEAYMDTALHDPAWGYYAHNVVIGDAGHFATNPETLSPHYGRWIANWAYKLWRDMLAQGELSETDAFAVVEFGAGNGRLACDVLDRVANAAKDSQLAGIERERWQTFAARMEYHIYEMSGALRARQRRLLGEKASIASGDARRPHEVLERDFPGGLRGLVVTNELPDAFGVHKVVLTHEGQALAALVVPRVEANVEEAMGAEFASRMRDADHITRETFGIRQNPDDLYLDGVTYLGMMRRLAELSSEERETLLASLWFEEAYIPASSLPELAEHLSTNAREYAVALAREASSVVCYVNVQASQFIRRLGSALRAGFILTIDYGDTTWGLIQGARRGDFPFRVYGEWRDYIPRPNDPYAAPGTQDMTADVNFTDLAQAAQRAGLSVLHFGPERDVSGDELPEVLEAAATQRSLAKFVGNPVFKLLVVGTRPSGAFTGPLSSCLPLTRAERSIPASRRQRIPEIQRKLANLR